MSGEKWSRDIQVPQVPARKLDGKRVESQAWVSLLQHLSGRVIVMPSRILLHAVINYDMSSVAWWRSYAPCSSPLHDEKHCSA